MFSNSTLQIVLYSFMRWLVRHGPGRTQERLRKTTFLKLIGPRERVTACHEEATWGQCPGIGLN